MTTVPEHTYTYLLATACVYYVHYHVHYDFGWCMGSVERSRHSHSLGGETEWASTLGILKEMLGGIMPVCI